MISSQFCCWHSTGCHSHCLSAALTQRVVIFSKDFSIAQIQVPKFSVFLYVVFLNFLAYSKLVYFLKLTFTLIYVPMQVFTPTLMRFFLWFFFICLIFKCQCPFLVHFSVFFSTDTTWSTSSVLQAYFTQEGVKKITTLSSFRPQSLGRVRG